MEETWQMRFNFKKCHYIIYRTSRQRNKSSVYYLGSSKLEHILSYICYPMLFLSILLFSHFGYYFNKRLFVKLCSHTYLVTTVI